MEIPTLLLKDYYYICSIMKKNIVFAAICCAVMIMALSACTGKAPATLRYRFASQEEGQQLKLASTAYFDALTQNDIDWKLMTTGKTLDEFKAVAVEQIEEFTPEEKKAMSSVLDFISDRARELGFRLPIDKEIVFVKSKMGDEAGMGGYTIGNVVFYNDYESEGLAKSFEADSDYDADYREYVLLFSRALLAHEIFHCITRNNPQFRQLLYNVFGFTVMDRELEFGPTVKDLLMHNPDVEHYDNWAEFTIDGQKKRCALISVYCGTYADAVATNPKAHFFDLMHNVLVPLDEPDTMIPIEEVPDFYDVIGRNTDYILSPEEFIADNFSYLIAFGLNGHYDLELENRKVRFVPYGSPELIRALHSTLVEHFPAE